MKAVGKVAFFMYGSLLMGKIGDKMIVYLVIIGSLLYTPLMKRVGGAGKNHENKDESEKIKNEMIAKIMSKIPKYSDLQKKKE